MIRRTVPVIFEAAERIFRDVSADIILREGGSQEEGLRFLRLYGYW